MDQSDIKLELILYLWYQWYVYPICTLVLVLVLRVIVIEECLGSTYIQCHNLVSWDLPWDLRCLFDVTIGCPKVLPWVLRVIEGCPGFLRLVFSVICPLCLPGWPAGMNILRIFSTTELFIIIVIAIKLTQWSEGSFSEPAIMGTPLPPQNWWKPTSDWVSLGQFRVGGSHCL